MFISDPFGMTSEEFGREMTQSHIGKRIRAIRLEEDMSRGDLGEKVGLGADRIQQYENGRRKPKFELLKKIADALGVEASALLDPQMSCYVGAMFAFFEMETFFDLRIKETDGQMCICFGESQNDIKVITMNRNLKAWYDRRKQMEEDILNATSEEETKKIIHEYHLWEWNFPYSIKEQEAEKKRN